MQVVVPPPLERAFKVFTEQFDRIKPRGHNKLQVPIAETVFEPRVGGHVYDRGVDGSDCRWARVLAHEAPHRVVISWDITPRWQVETNPDRTSEVEVRFIAESPDRTRVALEHRKLEAHGEGWEAVRGGAASDDGWPLRLQTFTDLFLALRERRVPTESGDGEGWRGKCRDGHGPSRPLPRRFLNARRVSHNQLLESP